MRAITLVRGEAGRAELGRALDLLGVRPGAKFVVMAESWRNTLNRRAVGLEGEDNG